MPSARRTLFLPPATLPSARLLIWPDKDPNDTLDYTLDCSNFLADAGNDQILAPSVEIAGNPTDLTFSGQICTGTAITWLIGGGLPGGAGGGAYVTNYAVRIAFNTAGGLSVARTISLPVRGLAPNPAYPYIG